MTGMRGPRGWATVMMVLLSACATGSEDSGVSRPYGGTGSGIDGEGSGIELVTVASGLEAPLFATHAGDGTGTLYVVEQTGAIRMVAGGELADPFLDIGERIVAGGEQGLLGLAFHPRYEDNGRFFVSYTDLQGDDVVAEYLRDEGSEPASSDPDSERILLRIDDPYANHNGGALAFGEDGYLYIATGDGGSAGDPLGNGQDLGALLGKILRIDVDDPPPGGPYRIPDDNPFVGRPDARPEIWAYGLRNPWRFSFDSATGDIWIGDVGQSSQEEIDRAPGGKGGLNYGWNITEGTACYQPEEGCDQGGLVEPAAVYSHEEGCSVTGGYVYRGSELPELRGTYLYSDYCSGTIWGLDTDTRESAPRVLLSTDRSVSSFGLDQEGELYLTDISSGELLRVASG